MRIEFLVPEEFAKSDNVFEASSVRVRLQDLLGMVGVQVPAAEINKWTRYELMIAWDYAHRRHLVASDQPRRLLRAKPEFVRKAQLLKSQGPHAGPGATTTPGPGTATSPAGDSHGRAHAR